MSDEKEKQQEIQNDVQQEPEKGTQTETTGFQQEIRQEQPKTSAGNGKTRRSVAETRREAHRERIDRREQEKTARMEHDRRLAKARSGMSIDVIQYNHVMKKLIGEMEKSLDACKQYVSKFGNQRQLVVRSKMTERVISSAIRLLSNNKLQLWMIDDKQIEEGIDE